MQQILGHLPLASARKLAKAGFKLLTQTYDLISIKLKTYSRLNINTGVSSHQQMTFYSPFHKPSFSKILVFPYQGTTFQQHKIIRSKKTIPMML